MAMLHDILTPAHVLLDQSCTSKKQLFQTVAECLAPTLGISPHGVVDVLWEREQLGTTGVGAGIAIPHGKLAGLTQVHGCFVRLNPPLPFGALDEQPVDLAFILLAPAEAGADHLHALGRVAKMLRDPSFCSDCRQSKSATALHQLLVNQAAAQAA